MVWCGMVVVSYHIPLQWHPGIPRPVGGYPDTSMVRVYQQVKKIGTDTTMGVVCDER
jgi:hypothetical protein